MAVNLKSRHTVKPAKPTCNDRLTLSELDQTGMVTHVSLIYFYRPSQDWLSPPDKIITALTDSLSRLLVTFYPLAGRLHSLGQGRFELECNAEGVEIIEAESEAKLDDFGDFSKSSEYQFLLPFIDYSKSNFDDLPLLVGQLTKLKCGGLSLGFKISHAVVDGTSILNFFIEWVNIARGDPVSVAPSVDRKVIRAGKPASAAPMFDHSELNNPPLLIGENDNIEERKKKTVVSRLKVNKTQLEKLKIMANSTNNGDTRVISRGRGFSRYEILTGHAWRCACLARKHEKEQPTALSITVDARSRMKPPLPREFFGNAIVEVLVAATSGEIVSEPLSYVTSRIRKEIEKVSHEYVNSMIDFFKNEEDLRPYQDLHALGCAERSYYGNPNLEVVSWVGMPIYGLDLGWGKELYMGPGKHTCDGDMVILPSPEGDGSLVVSACLQVAHMDAFKNYFYEEMSTFPPFPADAEAKKVETIAKIFFGSVFGLTVLSIIVSFIQWLNKKMRSLDEPNRDNDPVGREVDQSLPEAAAAFGRMMREFMAYQAERKERIEDTAAGDLEKHTVEMFIEYMQNEKPVRFTSQQIEVSTWNYSTKLGSGGFGHVYKGELPNGMLLAVKVLHNNGLDKRMEEQFMAEVGTIGRTYHRNLVRLYGFCFDAEIKALVYEFMENGSLDKLLFRDGDYGIEWEKLYGIAIGAARGLEYLHHHSQKRIIHYDIKPGNILLDSDYCPKIADFGLAKLCNRDSTYVTFSGARGTPGYAAPELWLPFPITYKCDVYSFGMMLFEIVGRRRNLDINLSESQEWFPKRVWERFEKQELLELMADSGIEEKDMAKAKTMFAVALWCVQYSPDARPTMSSVVQYLEGGVEVPTPSNPFPHLISSYAHVPTESSSNSTTDKKSDTEDTPIMRKYEIEVATS